MESLPQVWDVASTLASRLAPDPAEVAGLAAAEQARVTWADRVRGSTGLPVRARLLTGTPVSGVLTAVFGDGIVVADLHATWVIRQCTIARLELRTRAPVPASGRERGPVLGAVRDLADRPAVLATLDGVISRVRMHLPGADHLVVTDADSRSDRGIVPWDAVAWVRSA